jgi:glyoxylase-like metal-dependent hydrolase (beta-lactamase superfamily II)
MSGRLETHIHSSSEKGLSSVTTLIVGAKGCVLIDPPFLVPDAKSVVEWIRSKSSVSLQAVFVTHQ